MSATPWTSVSQGQSTPGAPVAAVLTGPDRMALFVADPRGEIFTTSGSAEAGWDPWSTVSEGRTTPGGNVTAVATGVDRVALFAADPLGGIFTTAGSAAAGWAQWTSVSEGQTAPGGRVTALFTGPSRMALFVADPLGGVFTTAGSPDDGWDPWSTVAEGQTTPGAPVAAVLTRPGRVALFVADPLGGVFTTAGSPDDGWAPWSTVAEGQTTPGAPVAAVLTGRDRVALFVADPLGGIFTTSGSGEAGWAEWTSVSEGQTTPGGNVTAVRPGAGVALFVADPLGGIFTTSGSAEAGWDPWSTVSQGQSTPGAPVAAVVTGPDRVALFVADPLGGIFTNTTFRIPGIPFVFGVHNLSFDNFSNGVPSLGTFAETFGLAEITREALPILGHPFLSAAFFAFYRKYLKGTDNHGLATGFCTSLASLVTDNFWTGRTDTHDIAEDDVRRFLTAVHGKLLSRESLQHFHHQSREGVPGIARSCRQVETTFIRGANRNDAPLLFFIPDDDVWNREYFEKLSDAHCVMPYRFAYPPGHPGPKLAPDGTTTVTDLDNVELFVWDCNRPEDPDCKVDFRNVDGQIHYEYSTNSELNSQNGFTLGVMTNGDYLLADHDLPFGGDVGVESFIFEFLLEILGVRKSGPRPAPVGTASSRPRSTPGRQAASSGSRLA